MIGFMKLESASVGSSEGIPVRVANETALLEVSIWRLVAWQRIPMVWVGDYLQANTSDVCIKMAFEYHGNGTDYVLSLQSKAPTRVRLSLLWPTDETVYPLIPGVCHGDNSKQYDIHHRYPHLSIEGREPACSPEWEWRADRASYPLSLLVGENRVLGLSIDPYTREKELSTQSWICNGLAVSLPREGGCASCSVTVAYRNLPTTYVCQDRFEPPKGQEMQNCTVRGRLYSLSISSRLELHSIIRNEYTRLNTFRKPNNGAPPSDWDDTSRAINALRWGLVEVSWDFDREVFSNPNWNWETERFDRHPDFGFHEIAWTAGATVAFPVLQSGLRANDPLAVERARRVLDRIANAVSPASGLFHDAVDKEGQRATGWWAHYDLVPDEHYAYLNGQAAYYLLLAYVEDKDWSCRDNWLQNSVRVLTKVLSCQRDDGALPWSFSRDSGKPLDYDGFAGCWFVPAFALAHKLTGEDRFLQAAHSGQTYYRQFVHALHCYGTPLDTCKAVDEEGNLAYIKAARLLHEVTGATEQLDELRNGLEYELLWRYGYNTRPVAEPLKSAPWVSAGGSLTSVANPHTHPMGLMIAEDMEYYLSCQKDSYLEQRLEEQIDWALISLSLMPEQMGFGHYGTLSERACPSDGLVLEEFPDGRLASCWFTHHSWGCANILEALLNTKHEQRT